MDEKYMKRFHSFQRSLRSLGEARERDMEDSFVLSGTGAKFSITFELAWKLMKDILIQHYSITDFVACSPKEVLKKAFQARLIDDQAWMDMLKVRNELAHDYDEAVIRRYCNIIVEKYISLFADLENTVESLVGDSAE